MASHHKHLLNDSQTLVLDSLRGLCSLNPDIALDETHKVIYRRDLPRHDQVSLISGGGSGHEPAHAGFVGEGCLSAAVCGNIFASPNASQIRRAIELVGGQKGTLIVVKNYTGDALNFGLASEQYKASGGTGDVRVLIVGDDVTVGRTQGGLVGRRGLAGTILVYKIAAALAGSGASLDEVEAAAKFVAENIGTVGVGLEHCHVPGTDESESHLGKNEIELGMGIHNEPGNQRLELPRLNELVDKMSTMLTSTADEERSFLPFKNDGSDEVVLMVNNLGAMSELELSGVAGEVLQSLKAKGYNVRRILAGTYMTSLNMPGFSITTLLLPRRGTQAALSSEKILSLLDEPANVSGWRWHARMEPGDSKEEPHSKPTDIFSAGVKEEVMLRFSDPKLLVEAITRACKALIASEPEITRQDQIAGDGDAGLTLRSGAQGVLDSIKEGRLTGDNVIQTVMVIASVVDDEMGGTSGALYSIFFSAMAKALRDGAVENKSPLDLTGWSKAYTRARPPSRTLIDPLTAFVHTLPNGLKEAVSAANEAAENTRNLPAKAGRAAYVDQAALKEANVPDPGAYGVAVIVKALLGEV